MHYWSQRLVYEIQELHDAEMRLLDALPDLSEKARDPRLKAAIEKHLDETEMQIARLERVAQMLEVAPDEVSCMGMRSLIHEAGRILDAIGDPVRLEAALIGAAQKMERYKIAAYETVRSHARNLGLDAIAELMGQSLEEEFVAHETLAAIAEGHRRQASFLAAGG